MGNQNGITNFKIQIMKNDYVYFLTGSILQYSAIAAYQMDSAGLGVRKSTCQWRNAMFVYTAAPSHHYYYTRTCVRKIHQTAHIQHCSPNNRIPQCPEIKLPLAVYHVQKPCNTSGSPWWPTEWRRIPDAYIFPLSLLLAHEVTCTFRYSDLWE